MFFLGEGGKGLKVYFHCKGVKVFGGGREGAEGLLPLQRSEGFWGREGRG